jgi:Flp pilus assembly protein CpaB
VKSRNNIIIVVGVVLAVLGAAVAVAYLRGNDGGGGGGSTQAVVVATRAVGAGTPATGAALSVKNVDSDAVPGNAVTSTAELNGQVALFALSANQVVTRSMFGVQATAASGGVLLPSGKKGIGVELGFAPGALRYVVPGNKIDIYDSVKAGNVARTAVLLRGITVIATTPGAGTGASTAVQAGPGNLDFLLAVSEAEALKIVNAQAAQHALYFSLASTTGKG